MLSGQRSTDDALESYARFSDAHAAPYRWMLRCQRLVPRVAPRLLAGSLRAMQSRRFLDWAFNHYLEVAHPRFVTADARGAGGAGGGKIPVPASWAGGS